MSELTVFISYSHDSPEHADRVLALADQLIQDGINCFLDQYETSPPEGWPKWMDRHIAKSDSVIVICTKTYYRRVMGEEQMSKGRGVKWESTLAYQHIYSADAETTRFIPVLFESGKVEHIPTPLQGATYYYVDTEQGYEDLYRRLTNQPRTIKPELGKLRTLPPRERKQDFFAAEVAGQDKISISRSPTTSTKPAAILALMAGPLVDRNGRPLDRLDRERETRQLCQRLREIDRAATLQVELATPESIPRLLLQQSFDILHFSGHGSSGELAFEDGKGGLFPLRADELKRLITPGGRVPFRLAFLSACHSASLAPALIEAGVPHVVTIDAQAGVLDAAGAAFARNFYPALMAGRSVAEAFEIGQAGVCVDTLLHEAGQALAQPNLAALEEAKFLLLPPEADHDVVLFPDLPQGELTDVTPPPTPHNLPARPEVFTGRARELHTLLGHLLRHRVVELTGMGGMGKTELAREAGRWLAERRRFPNGIHFVDLREVAETTTARLRVATALELNPALSAQNDLLASALRGNGRGERLLILDDLDFLVAADRPGLRALLQALYDAEVHLLLTTRERVGRVPAQRCGLGRLEPPEDERLFLRWAGLARADLMDTQANLEAVLHFLDGWPLAIVLAAPLLADTSLARLQTQLEQTQEQVLADPDMSPEERDKLGSVAVSLELSLRRLRERDPAAADFLPLLALFPAGADPPALEAITGPGWATAVPTLRALSLVEVLPGERVRLPSPARSRAARALPDDAQERYGPAALAYYRELTTDADDLITGGQLPAGVSLLARELPNLHFWLEWGYEHEMPGEECIAARLTGSLRNFYMLVDWPPEAEENFRRALEAARRAGDQWAEANTLKAIGDVQQFRDERDAALDSYRQALALFRAVGDRLGEANTLQAIGDVQQFRDERDAALDSYRQALALFRAVGDRLGEANTLQAIGDVQQFRDERDAALDSYRQALALFRAVGDRLGEANTLKAIGDVQQFRKEIDAALDSYRQALALFRAVGDRLGEANTLMAIGDVQQFRDERDAALDSYRQALALFRAVGSRLGEANTLQAIGDVQQFRKEIDAALDSYRQALALFRAVGSRLGEANTLQAIGDVQQFRKEIDAALDSYRQALALFRAVGSRLGEANTLQAIGDVQQFRDERDAALDSYRQALALFRAVGARLGEANTLLSMAGLEPELEAGKARFEQSLALYQAIGDLYSIARGLYYYALYLLEHDQNVEAVPLLEQSAVIFEERGLPQIAATVRAALPKAT